MPGTARRRAIAGNWCADASLDDDELDTRGNRPKTGWNPAIRTGVASDIHPPARPPADKALMTLTIHDDSISSDRTPHTARLIPGSEYEYAWEVSWLSRHRMDRLTAVAAMMFADTVGSGATDHDPKLQLYANFWAADLGLTTQDALAMACQPPGTISTERGSAEPDEPEPGGS